MVFHSQNWYLNHYISLTLSSFGTVWQIKIPANRNITEFLELMKIFTARKVNLKQNMQLTGCMIRTMEEEILMTTYRGSSTALAIATSLGGRLRSPFLGLRSRFPLALWFAVRLA